MSPEEMEARPVRFIFPGDMVHEGIGTFAEWIGLVIDVDQRTGIAKILKCGEIIERSDYGAWNVI
jgi:hypothetical protein